MELIAQTRNIFGKPVSRLRKSGLIPAELYGHGINNIHLSLPKKEFSKAFKSAGENEIINLILEDKKIPVLIHDVQVDPISQNIIHVDLYQVKMTEKIIVNVPLEFTGEAPAVKEKGGILVKAMQDIKIEALPGNLPHSIKVDLSPLNEIGKSIYVSDLSLPSETKTPLDPQTVVATVIAKTEEVTPSEVTVEEIPTEAEIKRAEEQKEKSTETPEEANK